MKVNDKRLDWFKTNIDIGAVFTEDTRRTQLGAGNIIHYHGGQMPMLVTPRLPTANPGLDIRMEGVIKKGAASLVPMARRPFGRHTASESLGTAILQEPAPAPALPEDHSIEVKFFQGAAAVAFKVLTIPFKIGASVGTTAIDTATIAADNAWLNGPIGTPGTLFHHMDTAYGAGSIQKRVHTRPPPAHSRSRHAPSARTRALRWSPRAGARSRRSRTPWAPSTPSGAVW